MTDNWMTPEHVAAALEGIAANPIAQAYAEGGPAARDTISNIAAQTESAELLRYMIHGLMLAAGYSYDPDQPLTDQVLECDHVIRRNRQALNAVHDALRGAITGDQP